MKSLKGKLKLGEQETVPDPASTQLEKLLGPHTAAVTGATTQIQLSVNQGPMDYFLA